MSRSISRTEGVPITRWWFTKNVGVPLTLRVLPVRESRETIARGESSATQLSNELLSISV